MDRRIERDAAKQPRRAVAETLGGPRVRRLVKRERHHEDAEADQDVCDVDAGQADGQRTTPSPFFTSGRDRRPRRRLGGAENV